MTFLQSAGDGVCKADTVGQVLVSRKPLELLVREFLKSGVSGRCFALLAGVKAVTFNAWGQRQRAMESGAPVRSAARPLSITDAAFGCKPAVQPGSEEPPMVRLGGGASAEVGSNRGPFAVPLLARLLVELSPGQYGHLSNA